MGTRLDAPYVGETCEGNQKVTSLLLSTDIRHRTGNARILKQSLMTMLKWGRTTGARQLVTTLSDMHPIPNTTPMIGRGDQPYP